jgi:hypothetical protein
MTIRDNNNTVIGTITTDQSMDIDSAMQLLGYEWIDDGNESGYLVDGVYYSPDDLTMDYDA